MNIQLKQFINSFKPSFTHLYIILYDLIFYLIITPLFYITNFFITSYTDKINIPESQEALLALPLEQMQLLTSQTRNLVIIMFITYILLAIIILSAWVLSRGLIYTTLMKKKLTKDYFLRFAGLNLILGAVVLIITFILVSLLTPTINYMLLAIILIILYFITMIYISFTKKHQIFNSLGTGLTAAIKKFPQLIIPSILVIIVFTIINLLARLLPLNPFISLAIIVILLAWSRPYFIPIASKLL